jgi:DNA polymerase
METLADNLISALQNKLAGGEKTTRIEPEVLSEFMRDFPSAPPVAVNTAPVAPEAKIPETATALEVKAETAPVLEVKAETTPVSEAKIPETTPVPEAKAETAEIKPPAQEVPKQPFSVPDMPVEEAPLKQPADINSLNLEELRIHGNTCSACSFSVGEKRSETTAVNEQADLMIITEPAGRSDEYMSDPFHGEAGTLLLKMIRAMNIDPDNIYLCMAHRCYGPGAREKIGESKPYLTRQIELVNPQAILIFGGAALNILLGEQSLMNCRGRWLEIGDIPAIATFPPAYLIHKAESKKDAWKDMQQVMSRLQA